MIMKKKSVSDLEFFGGGRINKLPGIKLLILFICLSVLNVSANLMGASIYDAQEGVVTGRVTEAQTGEAMPGVSVVIRGTTIGVATDIDGYYSISDVTPASVLVFSFVGLQTQEVLVGDRTTIDVVMQEEAIGLDEIIVVGYGSQVKATLTGSITQQRGEELQRTPALNLADATAGMFTGLKTINRSGAPGADGSNRAEEPTAMLIRGESTLGNSQPLIVIDGIQAREGFNQIDPRDVESITILKDASAAIYGARAANGVILITTKRGEMGRARINYNYNQGIVQPTRVPEFVNSWELAQFQNEQIAIMAGLPPRWSEEEIQKFRDGSDPVNYPNNDWHEAAIRPFSLQSRHNLSVRGGTDDVKYFASANLSDQEGMFKSSEHGFQSIGIRSNVDMRASDLISVSLDLSFTEGNKVGPPDAIGYDNIVSSAFNNYPYEHPLHPITGLPGDGVRGEGDNPLVMATPDVGYRNTKNNLYQSKFGFDFNIPVEGLNLDGYVAYDQTNIYSKDFQIPYSVYRYDSSTGQAIEQPATLNPRVELKERYNFRSQLLGHLKLNYQMVTEDHRFNAFVAGEIADEKSNFFGAERRNFTSSAVDQQFAGDPSAQFTSGNADQFGRMNIFGRISHVYRNRYMIDINLRYDGSTAFPKGNRWGFFPGASVGWIVSEESFFSDNVSFVNHFKLRGSFGRMGNDRIDPYQFLRTYDFSQGNVFGTGKIQYTGITQGVEPNPNITWEVAESWNVGVDALFLEGMFGLTLDRFYTERSNILTRRNATVPVFTGIVLPLENIGIVENKGWELELLHRNRIGDFFYSISPNVSYAKNKVVFVDEPEGVLEHQRAEGMKMGSTLNLIVLGIYRTQEEIDNSPHWPGTQINDLQYKDVDGDGSITNNDRVRQDKSNIPDYTFGANFAMGYRNFDFSMLLQGAANVWERIWLPQGVFGNVLKDVYENRPHPGNPDSKYPNITHEGDQVSALPSEFTMKDLSYVRLKNLELGYTMSIERLNMSSFRVYINGFNLLTFDKLGWFDPEGAEERGRFYPQNRIFNIGVNVTF